MNDASVPNSTASQNGDNERHSLQTYVSDLLALEQHIGQPLGGQLEYTSNSDYPDANRLIQELKSLNESHVQALKSALDQLGGHAASPIKSAWASLLGDAATAIGGSRKTKVTKWLRDDYTALNLANMSYTLLHATAVGMGNTSIAQLAKTGLADYARAVMRINDVVPDVVLSELRDDGVAVDPSASQTIRQQTQDVWRSEGAAHRNGGNGNSSGMSAGAASRSGSSGFPPVVRFGPHGN